MCILFLCSGNYYRSRFAEAVFNFHAQRQHMDAFAISRGLATHLVADFPVRISPDTTAALRKCNIALSFTSTHPKQVTNADLATAHLIIALNEHEHRTMLEALHPGWAERVEFWNILDVDAASPQSELPLLEKKVLTLLDNL